jgi:hypothetical protein
MTRKLNLDDLLQHPVIMTRSALFKDVDVDTAVENKFDG